MTDSQEQGVRLEKLIETLNLTQVSMAETLEISQGYISQMVSGSRNISRTVLQSITKKFQNVNVRWILTGEGEMFSATGPVKTNGVSEPELIYEAKGSDPLASLRELLEWHEARIKRLEEEVRLLRGGCEEE